MCYCMMRVQAVIVIPGHVGGGGQTNATNKSPKTGEFPAFTK